MESIIEDKNNFELENLNFIKKNQESDNEIYSTPNKENEYNKNINKGNDFEIREEWSNKMEYMLSVIGYVVDLGNCIRFPYITYKNGGGAFLIPYFVFLILIGVPMMFLEMSAGQYFRVGNIRLWSKINPYMKGIGYSSLLVVSYITLYYSTIIAYSLFYLIASFQAQMPWSSCSNTWNTNNCLERIDINNISSLKINYMKKNKNLTYNDNKNITFSPAEEYFNRYMLGIHNSNGIDNLGGIKFDLALCLAIIYILMYICIFKGVKSTGKAVYITATLPYIILLILLVHGLTLKGSASGIYYFLMPTFSKLKDFECWKDAAIQIFFTLGPGISVLTTYASYSKFNNNNQIDAMTASFANLIASFLAGIVVFASLGHLSTEIGKPIESVTRQDLGLSFIAYPEILARFKYPAFFSVIFFLMIINLGLDSGFGGLEAICSALADEFEIIKKYRKTSMALIHLILFLGSIPTVTYGGMYVVTYLELFSTTPALMFVVFFEAVTIGWFYGIKRFSNNIKEMFNVKPNVFWLFCWKFACPIVIFTLFFVSIIFFEEPMVDSYIYPKNFIVLGWIINVSIMLPIPIYALIYYIKNLK